MTGYNSQHQRNIDNQSPEECESLDEILSNEGAPEWLCDAVATAINGDDLAYLIKQVERHTGYVA